MAHGQNAIGFWKTGDIHPRSPVKNINPVSGVWMLMPRGVCLEVEIVVSIPPVTGIVSVVVCDAAQ